MRILIQCDNERKRNTGKQKNQKIKVNAAVVA